MNQQAVDYLEQNKDHYSKEVLMEALQKAGYDGNEISMAVHHVYSQTTQQTQTTPVGAVLPSSTSQSSQTNISEVSPIEVAKNSATTDTQNGYSEVPIQKTSDMGNTEQSASTVPQEKTTAIPQDDLTPSSAQGYSQDFGNSAPSSYSTTTTESPDNTITPNQGNPITPKETVPPNQFSQNTFQDNELQSSLADTQESVLNQPTEESTSTTEKKGMSLAWKIILFVLSIIFVIGAVLVALNFNALKDKFAKKEAPIEEGENMIHDKNTPEDDKTNVTDEEPSTDAKNDTPTTDAGTAKKDAEEASTETTAATTSEENKDGEATSEETDIRTPKEKAADIGRFVTKEEIIGFWKMIPLSEEMKAALNKKDPWTLPHQWFGIYEDGSMYSLMKAEDKADLTTEALDKILKESSEKFTYEFKDGYILVKKPSDPNYAELWGINIILKDTNIEGVLPVSSGDLLMSLDDGNGQPVYYRHLRKIK